MTRWSIILAGAVLVIIIAGCTRTYVGTGADGAPSPDGRFRLTLRKHGAYGRAYTDYTKKGVRIGIWVGSGQNMTETNLFWHEYKFVGSDLDSDIHWTSPEEVLVQLYDYGVGVSHYDMAKTGAPSNHIATLAFHLDKQTGMFKEKK